MRTQRFWDRVGLMMIASCFIVRTTAAFGCSLPLEARKGTFIARVRMQQEGPFRFLFDTGTTTTVIGPELAARLGVKKGRTIEALSTTGALTVSEAVVVEVEAGSIRVGTLDVLIAPIPQSAGQGRIDGILGMNFLTGRSYLLDVRRGCLETDVEISALTGGSRLNAREIVGRIAVESEDAQPLDLVLDSAASHTVLTSSRAALLARRSAIAEVGSAAGRQFASAGVVDQLRLGSVVLLDLPALIMPIESASEDALLPVHVFSTVYVNAARDRVVLNGILDCGPDREISPPGGKVVMIR